jgi:hypothetical protein
MTEVRYTAYTVIAYGFLSPLIMDHSATQGKRPLRSRVVRVQFLSRVLKASARTLIRRTATSVL